MRWFSPERWSLSSEGFRCHDSPGLVAPVKPCLVRARAKCALPAKFYPEANGATVGLGPLRCIGRALFGTGCMPGCAVTIVMGNQHRVALGANELLGFEIWLALPAGLGRHGTFSRDLWSLPAPGQLAEPVSRYLLQRVRPLSSAA